MTAKQDRFVSEYLVDLNASAAARRAGYSPRTAGSIGEENLKKPEIAAAIEKARRERSERTRIVQDRVLLELGRLAFANIGDLFEADGETVKLKSLKEMGEDVTACISAIQVDKVMNGNGVARTQVKVKLHDKVRALQLAAQHLGMFKDDAAEDPDDMEAHIARTAERVMHAVRKLGIQPYVPVPKIAAVEGGGNGAAGGLPTTQD